MIEIRIEGLPVDVTAAHERLGQSFEVLSASKDYPNRDSKLVRRFIKVELKAASLADVIRIMLRNSHRTIQESINPALIKEFYDGYQAALMHLAELTGVIPDAQPGGDWLAEMYEQILAGKLTEAKLAEAHNPPAPKPKRKPGRPKTKGQGFWLETESGPVHVLGNPARANDPKFRAAIEEMARAAQREAEKEENKGE